MGHTAVRAKDTPGFIVNHAGRGFVTEALRILGEGVADFRESTASCARPPASAWAPSN
jgi:3-hydroxybutyryl-CoA dehydrogenase